MFCDLITEVTSPHCCQILLVRSNTLKGRGLQSVNIGGQSGDHQCSLGVCLPHPEGLRAGTVGIRWGVGWGANSSKGEGVRVGKGE